MTESSNEQHSPGVTNSIPSASQETDFQQLFTKAQRFPLEPEALAAATVKDYQALYDEATRDLEGFWDKIAREYSWEKPWTSVREGQAPDTRWFVDAKLNITINCLDRHVQGSRANKRALIWIGEDGTERTYTFSELFVLVCQIANGLRSLGVKRGDRVCIYLPLTPEGVATMLACARLGAIHSVVYAGLGSSALRARIEDAQARVVVTADVGYWRGKRTPLKAIVDEAVAGLGLVEKVVVWQRETPVVALNPDREVDFYELCQPQSTICPAEIVGSEDPLFLLYIVGPTGTPKGCLYTHGGYMVGTAYYTWLAFDLTEDDIYWCMSDIGWIVGHSTMVYGPWANGTTVLIREGSPDYPKADIVWSLIEKYRITKVFTAPTAIRMFMKFGPQYPASHDLSSLRVVICAGESLNPEALLWAREHNQGGLLVIEGAWPQMFRTLWGDRERYLDYWRIVPPFYTSGDVATVDEDGYIAVLGRADDVMNVDGHRIGTADVESALVSHPAVAEAGVIGKPDPLKGEAIKAFVTLKIGQEPSTELKAQLVEHVRRELGAIATPSEVEFVAMLPKTRSGKIMRRVLRAREMGLDPGDLTTIEA